MLKICIERWHFLSLTAPTTLLNWVICSNLSLANFFCFFICHISYLSTIHSYWLKTNIVSTVDKFFSFVQVTKIDHLYIGENHIGKTMTNKNDTTYMLFENVGLSHSSVILRLDLNLLWMYRFDRHIDNLYCLVFFRVRFIADCVTYVFDKTNKFDLKISEQIMMMKCNG